MNRRNYRFSARKNCTQLLCNILEDRITPIVWTGGVGVGPPSLIPGDGNFEAFSGVVQVTGAVIGSGSLIQSDDNTGYGSYILTAAHVPNKYAQTTLAVGFDLPNRDKTNLTPFRISLTVPAGTAYQSLDPLYPTQTSDADLAILKLVDQELTTQSPTRLLVPPEGHRHMRLTRVATTYRR